MARRTTKAVKYIKLSEQRIREIEDLVALWPYETKAFMRARLLQYKPKSDLMTRVVEFILSFLYDSAEKNFSILKDPDILTDWQRRFEISGQTDPQESWSKILEKELSSKDYAYLLSLLEKELNDVHVPLELEELFAKVYRAHLKKEYISDSSVPKAPLILVVGPSGSGKTATVNQVIENVIFGNQVLPEIDLKLKKEELLASEPFWKSIEDIDPTLAMEIERRKRIRFYKFLSRVPLARKVFQKRIGKNLSDLQEPGLNVDYSMITPNDYQTALAGEPGNYFKKALGESRKPTIRHVEEAHSAFGKTEGRQSGVERQQRTLIDTANIVLDEIVSGKRDCLLVATTDQPERFDGAIYRRFVEKGIVIEISDYWKNPENLREIVEIELGRNDIRLADRLDSGCHSSIACIPPHYLETAVEKLYVIFRERSLKITPAYVRKLVQSIMQIKGDFAPEYLDDSLLVRKAFELVAKNSYGDLFGKVVDRLERDVKWDEYVGSVKDVFSEMANNCMFYGVSEEKGVVLYGPPGSGKTFLARAWLSENKNVHDISTNAVALQDPVNPIDGAVENLEKVYDIAKMIAPTVVFFDEGDALAPKRSPSGGQPSDKLTNKFLNVIDGEVPLHRVFTTLTTNRIDILDPALIRSKRLKVMEISGHLGKDDIAKIVAKCLDGVPMSKEIDVDSVIEYSKGLCNTPADYTAFVEKARSLRSTEYEVLLRARSLANGSDGRATFRENFVKFNFKTLVGILDAVKAPEEIRSDVRNDPGQFLTRFPEMVGLFSHVRGMDSYPLVTSHLMSSREEISGSPTQKGKLQLDEFLEAELSQEPQVGFIIGVGANEVSGMLLPIATSLTYSLSSEKVLVTGAVSSSGPGAAELDMAVQMTQQSAKEALTMIKNYLQSMDHKVSIPKLLGEFLDKYTIHHQLLSASYNVGGPSAGYALALNTLSALLHVPVCNDFGITGAPWTKGVKKGEVGGSVIIGGHKKKTEKVLLHLRRMYMPLQNYKDLEPEFLANYWAQGKDVLAVTHFGDLIPEVVWLDEEYEKVLSELITARIGLKLAKHRKEKIPEGAEDGILERKNYLRNRIEKEIKHRLEAIRNYLVNPVRDPHLSLEEIFKEKKTSSRFEFVKPFVDFFRFGGKRKKPNMKGDGSSASFQNRSMR